MKDRTLRILAALIEDFVETAMPVASKKLLESNSFSVSSATIRNEFAILEEVGLIQSPHVSAGKVPTPEGYRFFVDELMQYEKHEKAVQDIFRKHLQDYHFEKSKEKILDALQLLAHLSGNVAFAAVDNDRTLYLGLSNVLRSPEFLQAPEKAARIVEILEGQERFHDLLDSLNINDQEVKIFIGKENLLEEITSCAMMAVRFGSSHAQGYLGIIGPMRMKYGFNKALLKNVLEVLD